MTSISTKLATVAAIALLLIAAIAAVIFFSSNSSPRRAAVATPSAASLSPLQIGYLRAQPIGDAIEGNPWIAYLQLEDLDENGLLDVLFCDGRENLVKALLQTEPGIWQERALGTTIEGPVHVDVADIDADGDKDLLVAGMGMILPNRELVGSVVALENLGGLRYENRVLIENTDRVTDVRAADLDRDGDMDLVLGQFGYDQGAVRWLEQTELWRYQSHDLLLRSGTIHAPVCDIDGDGDIDILALVSQEWEEVYCFFNQGDGRFRAQVLWGSANQDYGSSGLSLDDLDRDGDLDLLYSNGDGFDYLNPGPRPWHSVQWIENRGDGFFKRREIGLMAGAFSPKAIDIDGDGDLDVVASSACNEWGQSDAYSLVCFENTGKEKFKKRPLALSPTHIVTLDVGDIDNDGIEEIVTGGFHAYPPWNDMSRILVWSREPKGQDQP